MALAQRSGTPDNAKGPPAPGAYPIDFAGFQIHHGQFIVAAKGEATGEIGAPAVGTQDHLLVVLGEWIAA